MPLQGPHYPSSWIRIGEEDFRMAERCLSDHDQEGAGIALKDALEKFFKAFLLKHGWKLQQMDDLDALLNEAIVYDQSLEQYRELCRTIANLYLIITRPRGRENGFTVPNVEACLEAGHALAERIRFSISHDQA